ncbi:NAD(P)-binding protein, partial [Streptomyces capparidis]
MPLATLGKRAPRTGRRKRKKSDRDVVRREANEMRMKENQYDVIVLGTGLAGSIMGAILARAGKKVLLIDSSSHP